MALLTGKKTQPYLTKYICDELQMTIALMCYFVLREGKRKKLTEIYVSIFDNYHNNETSSV